jgi:hypothetical protein
VENTTPTTEQGIRERIDEIWRGDTKTLRSCNAIVSYLIANVEQANYITLQTLYSSYKNPDAGAVLAAAKFLSGEEVPLLEMKFQYISDEDDEETASNEEYSVTDVERFRRTGSFEDPRTGEQVPDFERNLYMFFVPTSFAKEVLGKSVAP